MALPVRCPRCADRLPRDARWCGTCLLDLAPYVAPLPPPAVLGGSPEPFGPPPPLPPYARNRPRFGRRLAALAGGVGAALVVLGLLLVYAIVRVASEVWEMFWAIFDAG